MKTLNERHKCFKSVSIPVFILVVIFSMSSWIDMYGLFVETPIFVSKLPEGWALPSQMGMVIQCASIGPLIYTIAVKSCPNMIKEWPVIVTIISVGALSCLTLVFVWDKTAIVGGKQCSLGLIMMSGFLALVDCTSTVVYLPYLSQFKTIYSNAYFIGEFMGPLITGFLGLLQGVGGEPDCVNVTIPLVNETTGRNISTWVVEAIYQAPRFSVEVFMLFLFGMMVLSGIAFAFLHWAPFCGKENELEGNIINDVDIPLKDTEMEHSKNITNIDQTSLDDSANDIAFQTDSEMRNSHFILLIFLSALLYLTQYGIMMSIMPYSGLPYGDVAYTVLTRLYIAVPPLPAIFSLFYSTSSIIVDVVLTCATALLVGYHVVLAYLSPAPPLQGTYTGSFLMVSTGVLAAILGNYTIVTIAAILKEKKGRLGMVWCGACSQAGTFLGTMLSFFVINIMNLFQSSSPC